MSLRVPVLSFLAKEKIIRVRGKKLFRVLAKNYQKKSTSFKSQESGFKMQTKD